MRVSHAIVFVSNMERSVAFYRDVIGMTLRMLTPQWTEFATDGATLALHISENVHSTPDDPHHSPAGRCRPGLTVKDLDEFHRRMLDNHVKCIQEPTALFGIRLAQYLDPDELAISVSEERK